MRRIALFVTVTAFMIGCSSQPASSPSTETSQSAPASTAAAPGPGSDQDIIKAAMTAAPSDISANAAVVEPGEGGKMRQLRAGTNGWVCMAHPEVMCLDKQWQEWADAWMNKRDPKLTSVGTAYMLAGDHGGSNIDPFATAPTADNQWIVSPPHIMVVMPDKKQLNALPTDPHTGGPWVMFKGTPYAHIMVPMAPMPPANGTR